MPGTALAGFGFPRMCVGGAEARGNLGGFDGIPPDMDYSCHRNRQSHVGGKFRNDAKGIRPWSKRHKIKIGQTNPYSDPASSLGDRSILLFGQ